MYVHKNKGHIVLFRSWFWYLPYTFGTTLEYMAGIAHMLSPQKEIRFSKNIYGRFMKGQFKNIHILKHQKNHLEQSCTCASGAGQVLCQ